MAITVDQLNGPEVNVWNGEGRNMMRVSEVWSCMGEDDVDVNHVYHQGHGFQEEERVQAYSRDHTTVYVGRIERV